MYFLTSVQDVQRNEDAASYTCIAKNEEGYSANSKLAVSVMGKYDPDTQKDVSKFVLFLALSYRGLYMFQTVLQCCTVSKTAIEGLLVLTTKYVPTFLFFCTGNVPYLFWLTAASKPPPFLEISEFSLLGTLPTVPY
jgi:hypothetical protein